MYSVVTPEVTYINYSIERYDYSRKHDAGVTLLELSISLKEIREVSAQFGQSVGSGSGQIVDPKDIGAYLQIDSGKIQAKTPDVSTLKSLSTKFFGLF